MSKDATGDCCRKWPSSPPITPTQKRRARHRLLEEIWRIRKEHAKGWDSSEEEVAAMPSLDYDSGVEEEMAMPALEPWTPSPTSSEDEVAPEEEAAGGERPSSPGVAEEAEDGIGEQRQLIRAVGEDDATPAAERSGSGWLGWCVAVRVAILAPFRAGANGRADRAVRGQWDHRLQPLPSRSPVAVGDLLAAKKWSLIGGRVLVLPSQVTRGPTDFWVGKR